MTRIRWRGLWIGVDKQNRSVYSCAMHGTSELGKGLDAAIKRQLGLK
jgi:hypothetical protein